MTFPVTSEKIFSAAAMQPAGNALAACPVQHSALLMHRVPSLHVDSVLVLPMQRSVVTQYAQNDDGITELRLFYGDKEISFDEPELFAFGEQLALQSRFLAGQATGWGSGYEWERIRDLLELLVEQGVLRHGRDSDSDADERIAPGSGERAAPLPAGGCTRPRTWLECDTLSAELTGRPLDAGYLELVVPVFRVAHMVLDADGRQVGESNVFPKSLRLDVPTRWRTCIYPGTRYQTDRPMNVSALKGMRSHWPQMMYMLRQVRAAYLRRFPQAAQQMTLGDLERLSAVVLALPTWLVMRPVDPVANGQLHPALSSLFRVTDGLRMTMHQMLFVPVGEPTLAPDTPMDVAQILAYAERNYSFHSEHGVCAGPQAMIEAFLATVVDGAGAQDDIGLVPEPAVAQALADLDAAIDYGLLGLQAHAASFSLWPAMAGAYMRLSQVLQTWQGELPARLQALQQRLAVQLERIRHGSYLSKEQWRAEREHVYADMFDQCGAGLGALAEPGPFLHRIAAHPHSAATRALRAPLRAALAAQLGRVAGVDDPDLDALLACLLDYSQREHAVLSLAVAAQSRINRLAGRTAPRQPFTTAQIDIHNLLQENQARRLPPLLDEIADTLGVSITISDRQMALGTQHAQ